MLRYSHALQILALYLLLLCVIVSNSCSAYDDTPDAVAITKSSYIGNVETVEKSYALLIDGQLDKTTNTSLSEFSTQQLLTQITIYNESGEVDNKLRFEYNKTGLLIQQTEFAPNGDVTRVNKYYYDKRQKLSSIISEDSIGAKSSKSTFEYDQTESLKKVSRFDNSGQMVGYLLIEHDNDKKVKSSFDAKNNLLWSNEIVFDGNNIIEEKTMQVIDETSHVAMHIKNKYDKRGNVTEKISVENQDEVVSTFQYKYDSVGNWIERLESLVTEDSTIPVRIDYRKFAYYD